MTTLDEHEDLVTVINTFETDPDHAEALLKALSNAAIKVFGKQPGFISANLHMAKDKSCVINYAQWRSVNDLHAMLANPLVLEQSKALDKMAKNIRPVPCELRETHGPSI